MKVLTVSQMHEVDRSTIESGIPGIVLMENAGHRVVEFLAERFAPLASQRVVILCGKGNNGGDGMVIARQFHTRIHPQSLHVVLFAAPEELKGDAAQNYRMLQVCGCTISREIPADARNATLVLDALLGTGITGAASGPMLAAIQEINNGFPLADVVAVDIPSGMPGDSGEPVGEFARANATVTFTAPKLCHALPPNCNHLGELVVAPIGSPPEFYEDEWLSLIEPTMFRCALASRPPGGHKGTFGHVLVVAGSRGKSGAAALAGLGALRAGAGLVTVASAQSAIASIAGHAAELMTEPLAETGDGVISAQAATQLDKLAESKSVIAMGPGLGRHPDTAALVSHVIETCPQPVVLDADALSPDIHGRRRLRVLTPHPGEMARITGKTTAEIQKDRVGAARAFATERQVVLVLKGERTVIAFPDGRVWINPTGSPAMGTGGSGDVLTGLIAGMMAQFPEDSACAIAAAVYLHGLAGEIGARALGEKCLIAGDLLRYLPEALEECADLPHDV
ncbi:MAG TPA: NAD(P)H-hydrate dehydratase [Bryobacteraceae bacterium]|nr:NAD(P)H-hydrate dehydratase [Bryobacteraceae bacterium]